ncbi:hypothetical protein Bca4012_050419 [Brassica carinata]
MIVEWNLRSKYPVSTDRIVADHCLKEKKKEIPTMTFVVESLSKSSSRNQIREMKNSIGESTRGL